MRSNLKNMYELFFNDVTPEYINQYELVVIRWKNYHE